MSYKKYIKRGGKLYGPYIYESKRVGNKVISVYKGVASQEKISIRKPARFSRSFIIPVVSLLVIFALSLIILNLLNPGATGKVTLQFSPSYMQGEAISGALKLSLKAGELIPASTLVSATLAGEQRQFQLSDLLTQTATEGSFYVENMQLAGNGQGYGIPGEKKTYPDISFKLRISKEKAQEEEQPSQAEENAAEPEQTTETTAEQPSEQEEQAETPQEQIPAEETPTAQPSESKKEEKQGQKQEKSEEKGKVEESPAAEQPSPASETPAESAAPAAPESAPAAESAPAHAESSPITGAVVENEKLIDAIVSEDSPFSYSLEQGETAEIVQGSIRVNGEKIDESALNLQMQGSSVSVTASYSETETGFGADFIGTETTTIEIPLSRMNLTAQEGTLSVSLSYANAEIIQASAEINVEQPTLPEENISSPAENITEANATTPETNFTLPETNNTGQNITELNITNATLQNVTGINITTVQYQAVIGKPVRWKKTVETGQPENITIKLPASSTNITLKEIKQGEVTGTTGMTGEAISGKGGI